MDGRQLNDFLGTMQESLVTSLVFRTGGFISGSFKESTKDSELPRITLGLENSLEATITPSARMAKEVYEYYADTAAEDSRKISVGFDLGFHHDKKDITKQISQNLSLQLGDISYENALNHLALASKLDNKTWHFTSAQNAATRKRSHHGRSLWGLLPL